MAELLDCPACKNPCSVNATLCPKCGEIFEEGWAKKAREKQELVQGLIRKKRRTKVILQLSLIVIGLFFIGWCSKDKTNTSGTTSTSTQDDKMSSENRRKGFHCLSPWDGSHRRIVKYVEKRLRDPDSFEHIETKIWPLNPKGEHQLMMRYRAKNGFGGMTIGKVVATVKNSDCSGTITLSE